MEVRGTHRLSDVLEVQGQLLWVTDADRLRHQFRVRDWLLLHRLLPPERLGDEWPSDPGEPWWEPVLDLPQREIVLGFWRERRTGAVTQHYYAWQARRAAGNVAAYTPDGREVRIAEAGVEFRPPRSDYWLWALDVRGARAMWRAMTGGRDDFTTEENLCP